MTFALTVAPGKAISKTQTQLRGELVRIGYVITPKGACYGTADKK
jgi:hypothetical protein